MIKPCMTCGHPNPPTYGFCSECGSRLTGPALESRLIRAQQTQFALPDYLLAARKREDEARRRRLALEEGAGSGLIWLGAPLALGALVFSSGTGLGAPIFGLGLLLVIAGYWRMRQDPQAMARVGIATTVVGAIALGGVIVQVLNLGEVGIGRPLQSASLRPTPTPDPAESATPIIATIAETTMFHGGANHTGTQPGPGPRGRPYTRWRVFTGGELYSSPVVADETVYIGIKGGFLLALNAASGEERWRADLGGYIPRATPAIADGVVYMSTGYTLFALDAATGTPRWQAAIPFAGAASPTIADGTLFVATQEGFLIAFDAVTGRERWRFKAREAAIFAAPTVAEGGVFVGGDDGILHALEISNGRTRWSVDTGDDLVASPVVVDGVVYVSSTTPVLMALDALTGRERWHIAIGGRSSPALTERTLFLGSEDAGLYAVDVATGLVRWLFPAGQPVRSSPAIAGDTLYVGSGKTLHAIDVATGKANWSYPTGSTIATSPAVVNGVVYVGSHDGYLYAIAGSEDDA